MTSSTSSSNSLSRRRRNAKELICAGLSLGVAGVLTMGWQFFAPKPLVERFRPLAAEASPPRSPDWYLAYFNGDVEHSTIYNNVGGVADAIKDADVLFLGSSRVKYAFQDQSMLDRFFAKRRLRYFVLGFGFGEGGRFPEAIIRKFDLHPRWVIVNADPFFGVEETPVADRAIQFGYLGAWETQFEAVSSLSVQRTIHHIFPDFALTQWDNHAQWIEFRSKSDGVIHSDWRGTPAMVGPEDGEADPDLPPGAATAATEFQRDLDARGARLILTWIPPGFGDVARRLASLLKVPLIEPRRTGLATIDGNHLDYQSSQRLDTAFLSVLGQILDRR